MRSIKSGYRVTSVLVLICIALLAPPASAQTSQRCFPETGFCIEGRIREFWEQNGGLPVFGLPLAPQREEQIEGKPIQAQWFERNRLELHPENARPYDVLLGRLGADRLAQQGRDWFTFPKSEPKDGCRFFPETGHNVCGEILKAWRASGLELDSQRGKSEAESLALFGLPVSDEMTETIQDKDYQVQWFERARFELHPENQPPYHVLLGLLGGEVHGPAEAAAPLPQPPAAQSTQIATPRGTFAIKKVEGTDRFPPGCDTTQVYLCNQAQNGYQVLVVWLRFVDGKDADVGGDLFDLSEGVYVVAGDGTRTNRFGAGQVAGGLLIAFTPTSSARDFILFWPNNPPIRLGI
jgi:hypothetical protein